MEILLTDYIRKNGRRESSARHQLACGRFKTAHKVNARWWIDESEPYPDGRDFVTLDRPRRMLLETLLRKGVSRAECARRLGFHRSTITREIRRGSYEHTLSDLTTEMRYSCDKAQAAHELANTALGPPLKLGKDGKLAAHIEREITLGRRSPDAVIGRLRLENVGFSVTICTATLYSYIRKGVFLNVTTADLPERGLRKRKYRRVVAKRPPRGDTIERRVGEANDRSAPGHWEMDTIKGAQGTKECGLVLTERKSRLELIRRLRDGTSAGVVAALDALERKLGAMFGAVFRSITVDNGPENLDYEGIERSIFGGKRTKVYYCHPYSSFERGSNENQNRHIRRFIPKGSPLSSCSEEQISEVERWLNSNPRRMFGYRTSEEVFEADFAQWGVTANSL